MAKGFYPAKKGAALHMADGGMFDGVKRSLGFGPAETVTQKFARQDAERAAKNPQPAPAPTAPPAPQSAIAGYAGMSALQRREKEAGLKNGGDLQTGQGGNVPGTGKGDKIPAKYEPGEFVVSNAMLAANPGMREKLHAVRAQVLASQGKTPEQADAKNAAVIEQLGTPAQDSQPKGFKPELFFATGGDDRKKTSFGDAAAVSNGSSVNRFGAEVPNTPQQATQLANQGAAYVAGIQANAAANPAPAPTVPVAAPPVVAPVQSDYSRQMGKVGDFLVDAPMNAIKSVVGAPGYTNPLTRALSSTPAAAPAVANSAIATPAPAVPAAPVAKAAPVSPVAPAAPVAPVAAPALDPNAPTGNVTRVGNRYSGGNVAGDVNINGQAPRNGGFISQQNQNAAQALSDRAQAEAVRGFQPGEQATQGGTPGLTTMGESGGFGILDKGYQERRAAAMPLSSITASKAEKAAALKTLDNLDQRDMKAADNANAVTRQGMADQTTRRGQDVTAKSASAVNATAQQRVGLEGQKLGMEQTAAGFTSRAAKRIEDLQVAYESAPAEGKAAIAEQLRVLSGKEKPATYKVAAGGQQTDEKGVVSKVPDQIYNEQTGQIMQQGAGPTGAKTPHAQDIARLKANPKDLALFEQVYGKGSAKQYLGK